MLGEQILDFFERRSTRARVWSLVASQKGGEYRPPRGGFFRRTQPAIYAEIADVPIFVSLRTEGSGDNKRTFTVVAAPWLLGSGPELKVVSAGVLHRVGRALGLQDVPTGDASFDDEFVVKSPAPQAVSSVLGPRVRRSLRALGSEVACTVANVELVEHGVITDAARLSLVMDTVAGIAAHGHGQVRVLSELPGRFVAPRGPWASRSVPRTDLEVGASRIRAMAIAYPRGVYFSLRTDLQRELPDVVISFVDGTPEPMPPEGFFDPETFGALISLGNLTLRTTAGAAQLELPSDLSGEALMRAARWLGGFAEDRRQGAFR